MFHFFRGLKEAFKPQDIRTDLLTLIEGLRPTNSFEERIDFLKNLMIWIRTPINVLQGPQPDLLQSRSIRVKFLIQFLERHEKHRKNLLHVIEELMQKGQAIRLYCLTGIPENHGFFTELTDRVVVKILPPTFRERDLAEIFSLIFTEDHDALWIENFGPEILGPIRRLLQMESIETKHLSEDQNEALIILGSQISALGISKHIRRQIPNRNISDMSFLKLSMAINRGESDNKLLQEIELCRQDLKLVRKNMEGTGVSVELIYHLEKIEALLNRIEMILYVRHTDHEGIHLEVISKFIGRLIRDELSSLRVMDYLRQNLHLLTRKIVERTGERGDTYIAQTSSEQRKLFVAASWAGVLTAFTAIIKFWIGVARFPLFFEGLFFFINYAIAFLLMQRWHLALSSKQPAYTASALSKKFEQFLETKKLTEVIIEVRKIFISQSLATFGNLLVVVPMTMALDWAWFYFTHSHIMSYPAAMDMINKHDLLHSFTIFYAFLTGILLWLSSVVSGWTENWIVFRNIHSWFKENASFKNVLGPIKSEKMAQRLPAVVAGIVGNLTIAFLLSLPIIIGKVTGLPLDIRHVTLSAGSIGLALSGMDLSLINADIIVHMFLSVLIIGAMNFGISFYFAIRMAALARNVDPRFLKVIFKFALWRRKALRPSE